MAKDRKIKTKIQRELVIFHIMKIAAEAELKYIYDMLQEDYPEFLPMHKKTLRRYLDELYGAGLISHRFFRTKARNGAWNAETGKIIEITRRNMTDDDDMGFGQPAYVPMPEEETEAECDSVTPVRSVIHEKHMAKLIRCATFMMEIEAGRVDFDHLTEWYHKRFPGQNEKTFQRDIVDLWQVGFQIRYDRWEKIHTVDYNSQDYYIT